MNDFLDIVTYQKPCRVLDGECHCGMCELAGLTEEYGLYDEYPPWSNALEWVDNLPVYAKGPNVTHVRVLAAEVRRLRNEVASMETSEFFCNAVIRAAERWRRYYTRCADDACGCEDCKLARAIDATKEGA